MADPHKFRFSIDRGGTFTDIYAEIPSVNGGPPRTRILKLLSEDPQNYADAPREGIRRVLEEATGRPHPAEGFAAGAIEWIRMGTTVSTNALLERRGEPTLLVITSGHGDALRIGRQSLKPKATSIPPPPSPPRTRPAEQNSAAGNPE